MLQVKIKHEMSALLWFSVRIMALDWEEMEMTVRRQELSHRRGSKKHFGRKMIFQFTIWRELASAEKKI